MERKYNIGVDIDWVCQKYNIKRYTIREDGKVDVDGNVYLNDKRLTKLPLEFGIVTGNFNCNDSYITSLKGAPEEVGVTFFSSRINSTSLDDCPKKVKYFFSTGNNLLDVKGIINCKCEYIDISDSPICNIIKDIKDLEHFYLINPLNGNELSKELYDEVREDLNLPPFDYNRLDSRIILKNRKI